MKARTLSLNDLRSLNACSAQMALFQEVFGGMPAMVTPKLCVKHAGEFDWWWAGYYLLNPDGYAEFVRRAHWYSGIQECAQIFGELYIEYGMCGELKDV